MCSKFKDQQRGHCGWSRVNEAVGGKREFRRANWELLAVYGLFKGFGFTLCEMESPCSFEESEFA